MKKTKLIEFKLSKKILFTLISIISILCFVSCGNKIEDVNSIKANQRIVRISHGQPIDHPVQTALLEFKKYVEENTDNRYKILVYPNALLGSSKNALELCQTGALEFVVCSASNMETFNSIYSIFSVPYLFNNVEAYHATMADRSVIDPIYNSTENEGLVSVAWFDAGTRNFYTQVPVRTVEDVKGMKIRVQPSPTNVAMMDAFGAGAVPMAFSEVYTALQNKTIDGAENNEMALTTVKHGEVVKYYNYNMHQMVPDLLVANLDFMNKLDEHDKKVFEDAVKIAEKIEQEEWIRQTEEAKQIAKDEMHIEFIDSDVLSFKEKVLPLHKSITEKNPALKEIYDRIEEINKIHTKEVK